MAVRAHSHLACHCRAVAAVLAAVTLPLLAAGPAGATAYAAGPPGAANHADVCTNSDASPCPDSYFTGPLGRRNVLPSRTGALLIEQYGGVGTTWSQRRQAIAERQSAAGRRFDGIHVQYWGSGSWDGVYGMENPAAMQPEQERWAISQGASFVAVTWTPNYTIAQMNRGEADAIWAKAAAYWRSYTPVRIMLRPFAEFNLPTTYGAVASGDNGRTDSCGRPFQDAWRRMVGVFRRDEARNVGFWFSPEEGNSRSCIVDSYPGDEYVDWVGSDAYNECAVGDRDCYSTPLHPGWASFGELFNYSGDCAAERCPTNQHDLFGPRKPFVIGETGTVYDPREPAQKGEFFRRLPTAARSMRFLRGVSIFDQDVSAVEGGEHNWLVDWPRSDSSVYAGFRQMASDPWLKVGSNQN